MRRWLIAVLLLTGCPEAPDPCLWTVTNNIGVIDASTDLITVGLRAGPSEEWGENVLGEVSSLPFGESFSFLVAPGAPALDVRGSDSEGTTWSRYEAMSCADGQRLETILTSDDLDVPCTWTVTNQVGDAAVNYALFDVWVRVAGAVNWGDSLLGGPIPFGESVEFTADVGWTYDLSAMDQDGIYFLRLGDQTCASGDSFESTITFANEAPPCIWEATNTIDGALGPLGIVALEVVDVETGEGFVTEFLPPLVYDEMASIPFWPRTLWTLRAYDELGQSYSYPESALCLDGGEVYGLDITGADVDQ